MKKRGNFWIVVLVLSVLFLSVFFRLTGFQILDENQTSDNLNISNGSFQTLDNITSSGSQGFQSSGSGSGNGTFEIQVHPPCPFVVNSATTLSSDNLTGACFYINASNIVFNCAGYTLNGNSRDNIFVITNQTNVTIKNCKIYDSAIPILINESSNVTIYNNTINYSNLNFGVKIYSSVKDSGTGNNISSNIMIGGTDGISVGSERNIIENNLINGSSFLDGYGIYVYNDVINLSGNSFYGNRVFRYNYGFYSDGFDVSIFNFTIDNDEYYNGTYGIYLYQTGSSESNMPTIRNSRIYNTFSEGLYLEISNVSVENVNFSKNNLGGTNSGLLADSGSSIWLVNGQFNDSKKFAMLINSPVYANWTITNPVKCNNNNLSINGNVTFQGGILQLHNCIFVLNGIIVNENDANITSFGVLNQSVTAGESTQFNFTQAASLNMYIVLENNLTTAIAASSINLTSAPDNLSSLKGVDIITDNNTKGNLTWAYLKIYYNSSDLSALNINESTLQIYYYNTTSGSWQIESNQGVDTTNNFVWANVTHLSLFGAFGNISATSAQASSSSGGGGGVISNTTIEGYKIYSVNDVQLLNGYTNDLLVGDEMRFNLDGDAHSVKVSEIGIDSAILTVSSDSQTVTLSVGEEIKIDLNDDGIYDLLIKLNSVDGKNKTANLTISQISEPVKSTDNVNRSVSTKIGVANQNGINWQSFLFYIFIAVIIFVALIILFRAIRRRH